MRSTPLGVALPALLALLAIAAPASAAPDRPQRTFKGELRRYLDRGSVDPALASRARAAYDRAVRAARGLTGQRRRELRAVLETVDWMTERKRLSPSRLPALTLTLVRNRRLWADAATLPPAGGRLEFSGSEIVWEYYAGQGLQIQPLGTFGKANGLWTAGEHARLRRLFEEMVPLAAERGNALAWEYYFSFGGGRPPWVSGMAQATGLQALSRAIRSLGRDDWRALVPRALKLFSLRSPTGVKVATAAGAHYLQYSFAPGRRIINAFLQSVLGLYETADQLSDTRARRLAQAGDVQARRELPSYDTGAWSLYDRGGSEASLEYFRLTHGFLERLCERLGAPVYCEAHDRWGDYLRTPPEARLLTTSAVEDAATRLRFRLDKVSTITVAVEDPEGRNVLTRTASLPRGTHYVTVTPRTPGEHLVSLAATNLAGSDEEYVAVLDVAPAPLEPLEPPAVSSTPRASSRRG